MVILEKLEVKNFRKLNLALEFPEGMLVIKGPNEAGKSTILEAVLYALFGRTTRGTKDLAINHKAKTAIVKLIFSVDNRKYLVERVLRKGEPSEAKIYEVLPTGSLSRRAYTVKKTNEFIEKLLGGLSFNEILVTNVVAQKELTKLVEMKGQDRDKIVNALLGLESVNKALENLQLERREKKKDLENKQRLLAEIRKRLESYKRDLEDLKAKSEELSITEKNYRGNIAKLGDIEQLYIIMKEYKDALTKKREIEAQIKGLKKLQEARRHTLDQALQKVRLKKEEAGKLERYIEDLHLQIRKVKDRLRELEDLDYVQKLFEKTREKLVEVENLKKNISELEARREEVKKEKEKLERSVNKAEYEKKLSDYQRIEDAIVKTKISPIIVALLVFLSLLGFLNPVLFALGFSALTYITIVVFEKNRLNEKAIILKDELSKYEKVISVTEQKEMELKQLKEKLNKLLTLLKNYENELENIIKEIPQKYKPETWQSLKDLLTRISEKIRELQREKINTEKNLSQLEGSFVEIKNRLDIVKKEINDFEKIRKNLEEELEKGNRAILELEKEKENIVFPSLPNGIEFSEELYSRIEREYTLLSANVHALKGKMEQLRRQIEDLTERIEENENVEQEYEKIRLEVENLDRLVQAQAMAIACLKKVAMSIRETFLPAIQGNMNKIISIITGGRYKAVRLDSKYNIEVFDSDAGKFIEKDVFSGGTVDQLLLAMRLAFILSLLPETKKFYPRFLFLDEPLASSDTVRRKNILDLLTKTLRQQFKQIILITHLNVNIEDANMITIEDGKIVGS